MDIIRISESAVCIRCRASFGGDLKPLLTEFFGDAETETTTYSNGIYTLVFAEKRVRTPSFLQ